MLEGLREALQYVVGLGNDADRAQVLEICGKTYSNKNLVRYGSPERASAVEASSLSSMMDYILNCAEEFSGKKMIIQVEGPRNVRLVSFLDGERKRECLFSCKAETSEFRFGQWYDQEEFMIAIQSNFQMTPDLEAIMKFAGNVERKNNQTFSDDGRTQVATMSVGVASKADVIVPNPVELVPYRTFQEVEQPMSQFVFRISDKEVPAFKIVEAEGGIWRNEAVSNIKEYFRNRIEAAPEAIRNQITIIG